MQKNLDGIIEFLVIVQLNLRESRSLICAFFHKFCAMIPCFMTCRGGAMAWGAFRAKAESDAARMAASHYFSSWSVRKKLMCTLIPSVLFILVVAGYVTNWFSARYLNQALQRTAQVQNLAQAREMEQVLESFRLSLAHPDAPAS